MGKGFEEKTVYLPQLLMSAEAAKASFEKIKSHMSSGAAIDKFPVVIATVHGDIHDIGKNIVKLLAGELRLQGHKDPLGKMWLPKSSSRRL